MGVDSDHPACYYVCIYLVFFEGFAHIMGVPDHDHLYRIAEGQGGYFTTWQAHQAGFSDERLSYYAKSGLFSRARWGIYRLKRFPMSPFEDLIIAWLRTGPDSTISHENALALYDLTDVIPSEVHVTVPRTASRRRNGIRLHTSHITPAEITTRDGLPVTTVTRTIADVARSGLAEEHVQQAIREALDRGLTSSKTLRNAAERYGGRTRRLIKKALSVGEK
jgi:predicted transcriptional regulator of viral defense system